MIVIKLSLIFSLIMFYSYALGTFFNVFFLKNNHFPRITLGFFASLAICQLFLWYPMLRNYSTSYLIYAQCFLAFTSLASIIVLLIKDRWSLIPDANELKRLVVIFIIVLIAIAIFTRIDNGAPDSLYYIGNMMENYGNDRLNWYSGFSGYPEFMNRSYAFQSFYMYIAGLCKIVSVNPYLVSIWVLPVVLLIVQFQGFCFLVKKKKLNNWGFVGLVLLFLFVNYGSLIYASNGSSYKMVLFLFIMLLFDDFYHTKDKIEKLKMMFLFTGFVIAGISLQSSVLFQGCFMFAAFIIILIIKERYEDVIYLMMPVFSLVGYAFFYLNIGYLIKKILIPIGLFYLIFIVLLRYKKVLKWILRIGSVLLLIGLVIGTAGVLLKFKPFDESVVVFGALDYFKNFLPVTYEVEDILYALIWFFFFFSTLIYGIKNWRKEWTALYSLLIFIYFFNPISIYFISRYLTGEVYFRIDEIFIKSPLILVSIIAVMNEAKLVRYVNVFCSVMICLLSFKEFDIMKLKDLNMLYRMEKETLDIFLQSESMIQKIKNPDYKVSVMSTDLRLRYFTSDVYFYFSGLHYRNLYTEDYILNIILYRSLTNADESDNLDLMKQIISDNKISLIIMDNNQIDEVYDKIEELCNLNSYNVSYRLYYCKY